MPLTCSCSDFDPENNWYYYSNSDYITLGTKRGRRCCSCKNILKPGSICTEHDRARQTRSWVEERIYEDQVPMHSHYMCENCSDIFFNLTELGYCVIPGENMNDLLREYQRLNTKSPNAPSTA